MVSVGYGNDSADLIGAGVAADFDAQDVVSRCDQTARMAASVPCQGHSSGHLFRFAQKMHPPSGQVENGHSHGARVYHFEQIEFECESVANAVAIGS